MIHILDALNRFVWGIPTLVLILGVGLYLTIRTKFVQLRFFPRAVRLFGRRFLMPEHTSGVSPYQALCTALAATVGIGNMAGVAGAISIGGPGSIFWMWVCAILGMAIKYAEATLAVRYQSIGKDGTGFGGTMHMILRGLGHKWKPLATVYCVFGVIATFGVGNSTQINAVVTGFHTVMNAFGFHSSWKLDWLLGLMLGFVVTLMLFGGAKRIGRAAERLVPLAAIVYILLAMGVLVIRLDRIPNALGSILSGAFSPRAITGGVIGSAYQALRVGVSRGVFTNEAGMGTAAMAHGSAKVSHPADQGLMGIMEVFLDTIVICSLTALVILVSDVSIPYGKDVGLSLTIQAFASIYGDWIGVCLTLEACSFAFATVLGWGLYGIRCAQFLFGEDAWKPFALLQGVTVIAGALINTEVIWILAEIVNGLMALPNLITLILLSPELLRLTKEYQGDKNGRIFEKYCKDS